MASHEAAARDQHGGHASHRHGDGDAANLATDPVCGMKVDPEKSPHRFEHVGNTFHFCGAGCRAKFAADPQRYLAPKPKAAAAPPKGSVYTCPMHPEVRQSGPGSCPICGMALEPAGVSLESGPSAELVDMSRRFWIGAMLAAPLLVLDMASHLPGLDLHRYVPPRIAVWIELLLATPVVLWAGWPFLERGWASVRNRSLNMFSLISLGVSAAYLDSLAATFAPGLFPVALRTE